MSIRATSPFPVYVDNDGKPLSLGYVYFGTSGSNPETTPQAVYWDEALTIPAAQPIRTLNGFLVRTGTPANVYLSAVYSITVRNVNKVLLYSSLVNPGVPVSTAMIPVMSASTLAVARDALGVSKKIKGYQAISITHLSDTLEPSVAAGSEIEVDGTFYEFPIDEAATAGTWAAIAVSTLAYMYLVPAGAAHTWIYSATAPTWDIAKQGWYNGANRAFGMLYKDAASLYQFKNLIPATEAPLTFIGQITSTVNPFVFNLSVSSGSGMRVRIVNTSALATGLVMIDPNGADDIGSAGGGVACYLQNVDQSGAVYRHQFLDLVDSESGYWSVVGGQFCPHQTVDTDGTQYHLGKLHHLPLGNTTSRDIYTHTPTSAGFSAAISGTGVAGIPAGAKAIRARVTSIAYATGAGDTILSQAISDNDSNVPTINTAHPRVGVRYYADGAGRIASDMSEIDIPLNSLGKFYIAVGTVSNLTVASSQIEITAVGFYMGD